MGLKLLQKMGWKHGSAIGNTMAALQPLVVAKPKDSATGGILKHIEVRI